MCSDRRQTDSDLNWTVPGYTDLRELGTGATGRVVLSVHDFTGKQTAVKYLAGEFLSDAEFRERFRTEAVLLARIDSQHVARLHEYVESYSGAAIVMELVDGASLQKVLRAGGATTPEAALAVLKGSLLGLASAHELGIVHRDYKPANVLVTVAGQSKLVDFGIASDAGDSARLAGTPAYMAPEQWRGEPASPATDIYAVTATFYECVTGQRPYDGESLAELAVRHTTASVQEDGLPDCVRPLVRHGMAKNAEDRPRDASAFIEELETVAQTAYGPNWEESGWRTLAATVALLPALSYTPGGVPTGTTALATTKLTSSVRRRLSLPKLAMGAAALTAASLLIMSLGGGGKATKAAQTDALTSAVPGETTRQPASPSRSTQGSALPEASSQSTMPSSSSASPTGQTSSSELPKPTDGGSTTPSPKSTATAPTSEPPVAPTTVKSISVQDIQRVGQTSATTTITVTTSGTGPVKASVSWYSSLAYDQKGNQDGSAQTYELSGQTKYTLTADHAFTDPGCYWGALASTTPAADGGSSWQQISNGRCGFA